MDDIFVTQPFTARHVRFTKKLGFDSLGKGREFAMRYDPLNTDVKFVMWL